MLTTYRKRRVSPRTAVEHLWNEHARRMPLERPGERLVLRLETAWGSGYFQCGAAKGVLNTTELDPFIPPGPIADGCFADDKQVAIAFGMTNNQYLCGLVRLDQLYSWFTWEGRAALVETGCLFQFYSVPHDDVYVGEHQCVYRKSEATWVASVNPKHKRVTIKEAA